MATTEFTQVTTAVRQLLAARGALSETAIVDSLAQTGVDLSAESGELLVDVLVQDDMAFVILPDGRWCWAPALLGGRIFTCRLTAAEAAGDFIELRADVLPVYPMVLLPEFRGLDGRKTGVLLDGEAMEAALKHRGVDLAAIRQGSAALFPKGQFAAAGLNSGDLIGVRVTSEGLHVESVTTPLSTDDSIRLEELVTGARWLHEVVWQLCADDDTAFRAPVAPVTELAAIGGLSLSPATGEQVAPAGFNWDELFRSMRG